MVTSNQNKFFTILQKWNAKKKCMVPYAKYNWTAIFIEVNEALAKLKYQIMVRSMFYDFTVENILPNTKSAYVNLDSKLTEEKIAGNIPWGYFEDPGRRTILDYPNYKSSEDRIRELTDAVYNFPSDYQIPRWYKQPNCVEVWTEKNSLVSRIRSALAGKEVNVRFNKGYNGWEAAHEAFVYMINMMKLEGRAKKIIILYVGDWDPSGKDMDKHVKEQISLFAKKFGLSSDDYEFHRIMITQLQIDKYNLPSLNDDLTFYKLFGDQNKKGDSRTAAYVEQNGKVFIEADAMPALHPNDFNTILCEEVESRFDDKLYEEIKTRPEYSEERLKQLRDDQIRNLYGDIGGLFYD